MANQKPIKVIRNTGDTVALQEFTPSDTIALEDGGTGAITAAQARSNLEVHSSSYIDGQLATKAPVGHTHTESDITDLDKYTQAQVDSLIAAIDQSVTLRDFNGVLKAGYSDGGKILSVAEQAWQFVEASCSGTEWMDLAGSANNSNNGYTVPFDTTLKGFTCSIGDAGTNNTLNLILYIDGASSATIVSFSNLSGNQEFYGVLNIDMDQGEKLRIQSIETGGGNVPDVSVTVFSQWRGV